MTNLKNLLRKKGVEVSVKKNNLLRITWIVGIYATLILIFYLVVVYKVKWEDKDLRTYLYFYNCSNDLCTSTTEQEKYYGKIVCEDDICPYIYSKNDEYLVLTNKDNQLLYNYKEDKIISNKYKTYNITSDNNYIVSNSDNKYGVIDKTGEIVLAFNNNKIVDYKNGYYTYIDNNKYGIINEENKINISPTYEEVILIDKNIYAYLEQEKYYIASYESEIPINNTSYDYVAPMGDIILVVRNKQIDILNNNLQSNLLMKINSTYTYKVEKERESLELKKKDNLVYFSVYNGDGLYTNYIYDLKNNKLYN